MKNNTQMQVIGIGAVCFGAGILFSLIFPRSVLIFVEAAIIIGIGGLFFMRK